MVESVEELFAPETITEAAEKIIEAGETIAEAAEKIGMAVRTIAAATNEVSTVMIAIEKIKEKEPKQRQISSERCS